MRSRAGFSGLAGCTLTDLRYSKGMDENLPHRLRAFLQPFYQDLDGVSRFDDVERITAIARRLYAPPSPEDARSFELLLHFHGLRKWLEKIGNLSRTMLALGDLTETELRRTAASIRRLGHPSTEAERAVAAAILIDGAGVRGLAERLSRARREGHSVADVVRDALADAETPEWLSEEALRWVAERRDLRRAFCRAILDEMKLGAG